MRRGGADPTTGDPVPLMYRIVQDRTGQYTAVQFGIVQDTEDAL